MNVKEEYPVLYEAYEYYQKTGDRHFQVLPKKPDYLFDIIRIVPYMLERDFIENISDNLLNDSSINLVPLEDMSFDITFNGIRFIESHLEH